MVLITRDELIKKLGISPRTFKQLMREGIPVIKINRKHLRFNWDRVVSWLESREQNR